MLFLYLIAFLFDNIANYYIYGGKEEFEKRYEILVWISFIPVVNELLMVYFIYKVFISKNLDKGQQ